MRVTGLEPAHLAAPEPKSGVSASFTTPAYAGYDTNNIILLNRLFVKFCSHQIFIAKYPVSALYTIDKS